MDEEKPDEDEGHYHNAEEKYDEKGRLRPQYHSRPFVSKRFLRDSETCGQDGDATHDDQQNDLCEQCRLIDFQKIVDLRGTIIRDNIPKKSGLLIACLSDKQRGLVQSDCPFCGILVAVRREFDDHSGKINRSSNAINHISAYSFHDTIRIFKPGTKTELAKPARLSPFDFSYICCGRQGRDWDNNTWEVRIFCDDLSAECERIFRPRPVPTKVDYNVFLDWLSVCSESHNDTCKPQSHSEDFWVVDVHWLMVIKAPLNCVYAALSYTWGEFQGRKKTQQRISTLGKTLPGELPNTILDAMEVTKQLGFSYFWVDRFCIDQENDEKRAEQIQRMDKIFNGAELTIVAAAGDNDDYGLPGVGTKSRPAQTTIKLGNIRLWRSLSRPEISIRTSRWAERAWTLQEAILSCRRLIFTEQEVFFECHSGARTESIGFNLQPIQTVKEHEWVQSLLEKACFDVDLVDEGDFRKNESLYWSSVSTYSERDLTEDADIFAAFAGIASRFREMQHPVCNISGIPCPDPLLGSENVEEREAILLSGLTWRHTYSELKSHTGPYFLDQRRRIKRRSAFPSWSWTGWAGYIGLFWHIIFDHYCARIAFAFEGETPLEVSSLFQQTVLERVLRTPPPYLILSGYILDANCLELQNGGAISIRVHGARLMNPELEICLSLHNSLSPREVLQNFENKHWECIHIGAHMIGDDRGSFSSQFLIFEQRDGLAHRIGIMAFEMDNREEVLTGSDGCEDKSLLEQFLSPLSKMEYREVRFA
ncbi:hypothetical protein H2200_007305 [Cladophialophora chaetospira]|uniref:Heterokaryon incompatibility domain-containing protein n=1 Tax=Cladophialophora chaetospira TaxID=386627 RepID=A0AA38X7J3_9EURO|nr:hypothetical protein H2200_007305 [Cladophialophora chaetospira]